MRLVVPLLFLLAAGAAVGQEKKPVDKKDPPKEAPIVKPREGKSETIKLFDGKTLAGWKANTAPESFTVADGAIRVQAVGPTSSHLFTTDTFTNFELEATCRAEPNANSGIFVHTEMTPRPGAKLYLAKGYEIQLNSSAKEKKKTGSLYEVADLDRSPVDETKWFRVRIVVNGKHITVSLDGKQVVDYTEPDHVVRSPARVGRKFSPRGGQIALQAHDPESVWYFKDVRVKRLP